MFENETGKLKLTRKFTIPYVSNMTLLVKVPVMWVKRRGLENPFKILVIS